MSMFSQSLRMGDSTLRELEFNNPNKPLEQHPNPSNASPQSLDVIDESPTNKMSNVTSRSMRSRQQRTQSRIMKKKSSLKRNQSDSILDGPPSGSPSKSNIENYSQFFRDGVKENIELLNSSINARSDIDKYFKESMLFDAVAEKAIGSVLTETDAIKEYDLDAMFDKSDFFTQLNESKGNDTGPMDLPITIDDLELANISFDSFSEPFTVSKPGQKTISNANNRDGNTSRHSPIKVASNSQQVMWDDSEDFANMCDQIEDPSIARAQTNLMVEEDVALGIDNVTFTQDFLKQRSFENNLNEAGSEIAVNTFIRQEMDKCVKQVRTALIENDNDLDMTNINASQNSANMSNIVLNWSSDSTTSVPAPINVPSLQPNIAATAPPIKRKSIPKKDQNNIENWGLPKEVVREYVKKGIKKMFDWQVECLSNTKVLFDGANLVYSAPTSAGKTLVSELLMVKNVLEHKKKSLLILPFISVVREKMLYLQELLTPSGICVEGFFGGYSAAGGFENTNIAVCTIEKANSIVNKLLEKQKIETIGCIVVDEIHLISDPGRGYILELLLTKILYMCRKFNHRIQIVTMSATLPNLDLLTKWLDAQLYLTDFRPVALMEMIKIENVIYNSNMNEVRKLDVAAYTAFPKDPDNVGQLCVETILEGCSVIVFCPSKDWCETLSTHVAGFVYNIGKSKTTLGDHLRQHINMDSIEEIKSQLRNCSTGLDSVLEKTISYGCAFHHAGLTTDERDIIENAFKTGALKVIVATSTLSSGVNLPARRVIIRTPLFGGKTMNSLTYKQMIGRAGRTGKDTLGESILICGTTNVKSGKDLICSELKPLSSCLGADSHVNLKRAVLEIIAAAVATTKTDLESFANCTLLASERNICFKYADAADLPNSSESSKSRRLNRHSSDGVRLNVSLTEDEPDNDKATDPIATCMQFLIKYEFVRLQMNEDTNEMNYMATRLGSACLASSMPPGDGFLLFSELQKSRQCFVLESELHAVYLVTPFSVCYQMQDIDWLLFLDMWEKLPSAMRRVGEMVGVRESFLVKAMRSHKLDYKTLQIHKRFYTALALQELVNEACVNDVAVKYKCSRGLLQSLQQMASTFAGVVTSFCQALNWNMLALIIAQFKDRLFFGVHRDLIDLMKISNLNGQRARALYDGGFQTLADLANSDVFTIEKLLYNSISFDSKQRDGEDVFDADKRNRIRYLYITGKSGLTIREAAKLIIEDARRYLEQEMGLQNVNWSKLTDDTETEGTDKKVATQIAITNVETSSIQASGVVPLVFEASVSSVAAQKVVHSEDIFQLESPNNISPNGTRKRKSIDKIDEQIQPTSNRRSATRKSPRLQQLRQSHEKTSETPTKTTMISSSSAAQIMSADSSDEIPQTPIPIQKKSQRTFRSNAKTQRKIPTKSPPAMKKSPPNTNNPMQTQLVDVDDFDSICFSDIPSSTCSQLNSSHILSVVKDADDTARHLSELKIINVFGNRSFFKRFQAELSKSTEIGISLGIGNNLSKSKPIIGGNLLINQLNAAASSTEQRNCSFDDDLLYIGGIAICLDQTATAFYLNLQNDTDCVEISFSEKIAFVESIFGRSDLCMKMFDAKEQCKALMQGIPTITCLNEFRLEDPRIANWLLQPDVEANLKDMAQKYAPECVALIELGGNSNHNGAISMNFASSIAPKIRASIECCVTMFILSGQKENLNRIGCGEICKSFIEMEMPIQRSLFLMEIAGLAVDLDEMTQLGQEMEKLMKKLETKIYELNGRRFNINSSVEVAKVLGMRNKNGTTSTGKVSTSKTVLEKMSDPMSALILQYRKLGAAVSKTIRPLLRNIRHNRIHGNSISFTSTGRISMQEPNLQNIAKDFVVAIGPTSYPLSCRSVFKTPTDRSLISADFCQLELRILTHLSQDSALMEVMHSKEDVFNTIAAKWNRISDKNVTEKQRNDTKQICYGIIYGMGTRSLAEALKCDEHEAMSLSESFHQTYPGIRSYTEKIIKFAHQQGYVETLAGRRRYFSYINSDDNGLRGQAERQAVNTSIQGSAADVAKYAMLRMERNLKKYERTLKVNLPQQPKSRVDFVLHLHDELMYEVPVDKAKQVAKILKSSMENCAKLHVPLRVKVKTGDSWGALKVFDII